jgi:protein-tyrosine-phosphatase
VSAAAWEALERSTRCWVRVFAEERGMRASGRQGRGEVRSLLADYLNLVGAAGFFGELAELADGVLMDNRVILASRGLWPSASDRFNSDLHRWEQVEDRFLRRFTRAAAASWVPVMMGGHAVVAGGLMALVEAFEMGRKGRGVPTVLIVCTGNLCRSPMAEGLLRARLARDDARRGWVVGSAGVWTVDGRPASENAVQEMAWRGIDLEGHLSRSVTGELMDGADLVLAMTRAHAEALTAAFPEHGSKVHLLSEMVGGTYDIEDPYGSTRREYARTARQLERLIEEGYERIVALVEGTDGG